METRRGIDDSIVNNSIAILSNRIPILIDPTSFVVLDKFLHIFVSLLLVSFGCGEGRHLRLNTSVLWVCPEILFRVDSAAMEWLQEFHSHINLYCTMFLEQCNMFSIHEDITRCVHVTVDRAMSCIFHAGLQSL